MGWNFQHSGQCQPFSELWTAAFREKWNIFLTDLAWDIFLWTAIAFSSPLNPPCSSSSTQRAKLSPRVHECISRVLEKMLFAYPLINKRNRWAPTEFQYLLWDIFNDPNYIVLAQTTWHWLKIHIIIFFSHYILICSVADRLINNYLQGAQQLASLSLTSLNTIIK